MRKIVVLWGFKTAHATVTLRETENSREKSVVVRRLLDNMLVAGAAGHGNVAEGEDPALSAGLTSDTRIVFRRQLSYPLYYFRFVSYLALVMAGLHTTV